MELETVQQVARQQVKTEPSLFRNRKFMFLWLASVFSGLSLAIYLIAESWYVVNELGLKASLGIVMMATTIPRVLLMVVGGVMADRFRRSTVMFFSGCLRGVLMIGLVVLLFYGWLNIWTLTIFALCFGLLDAFFWPASRAILPSLVEKRQITRANSFMQTTNYLTLLVGPAIAGFTIKFGSYFGVFTVTGLLLFVASLFILLVKEEKQPLSKVRVSALHDAKEGMQYLRQYPLLLLMMGSSMVINLFLTGPVSVGIPLLVDQSLKGDVLDLSYLESANAFGTIAGAVLIGVMNINKKRPLISMVLIGVMGLSFVLLSFMTVLWFGIIVISVCGFCLSISNIIMMSFVQENTDTDKMGRVQGLMATASMGLIPLSYGIVSALLASGLAITMIMLVSCTILTLFAVLMLWRAKVIWTVD